MLVVPTFPLQREPSIGPVARIAGAAASCIAAVLLSAQPVPAMELVQVRKRCCSASLAADGLFLTLSSVSAPCSPSS